MTKCFLFKFLSAIVFSLAIFGLMTQNIFTGYSLLILGYCLLRKSDRAE